MVRAYLRVCFILMRAAAGTLLFAGENKDVDR
jgi:hypothetical protein